MTYSPNMNSMSPRSAAYQIDQHEIERVLRNLVSRQSGGFSLADGGQISDAVRHSGLDGWQKGQVEFAHRIAEIGRKQSQRHKAKFNWKHSSFGILRRLALVVMVATILAAQYL